ncbi:MAG: nicotinamide-nucleotide amidase [Pseudomonadota bacterium]
MTDNILDNLAQQVGEALKARWLSMATAESCTGGWVSEAITSIAGSSDWFDRGYITYSNRSKQEMLGVKTETLDRHGAVSEEVVSEMAQGALKASGTDIALAVSGIAGPGGAVPGKPVGTVCFAWYVSGGELVTETQMLSGDRADIRRQAVIVALQGVLNRL